MILFIFSDKKQPRIHQFINYSEASEPMEVEILAEIEMNSGKKDGKKTLMIRLKKAVIE